MAQVTLYTRAGCHLCEDAKAALERVRSRVGFELEVVDVDSDPKLASTHGDEVPVVFLNGVKAFKYTVDEALLERRLQGGGP